MQVTFCLMFLNKKKSLTGIFMIFGWGLNKNRQTMGHDGLNGGVSEEYFDNLRYYSDSLNDKAQ